MDNINVKIDEIHYLNGDVKFFPKFYIRNEDYISHPSWWQKILIKYERINNKEFFQINEQNNFTIISWTNYYIPSYFNTIKECELYIEQQIEKYSEQISSNTVVQTITYSY